jgi:uncharacterized protein DUF4845
LKRLTAIFWIAVLGVGGFVLYKVLPAYWNNYHVKEMIEDQAVYYTNYPRSDDEIRMLVAQKAQDYDVPLAPEQVDVQRTSGKLSISVAYRVHIDLPGYPFDLNFSDSTTNANVMR